MDDLIVLDCEVYPNYWLVAFKNINNGKVVTIEIKGEDSTLSDYDKTKLNTIMHKKVTFGFNSNNYDMPIILYALRGKTAFEIYELSNFIIEGNSPSWKTLQMYSLVVPTAYKHFDIQEPSPGVRVSLKLYGGRMNSATLQDLPIEPGTMLTDQNMADILTYCINDLDTTIELYEKIKDQITLRVNMSEKYGKDLLSKSDAQIAEAVIKSELQKGRGNKYLKAPKFAEDVTFRYHIPEFISFQTKQLQDALSIIREHDFELDGRGSIKLPKELKSMKIKLGNSVYQLGVGGLHSTEKSQTVIPGNSQILADRDVASYYPNIILNLKLYPKHLGEKFLEVYEQIVKERLKAKASGDSVTSDALKVTINGSFGKLGSKYSTLYSPDLMMAVTLTGQLSLLMLIEALELKGISVVSANTDGFVSLMDKSEYKVYDEICNQWESTTGFKLEETQYKALYSRDVNSYLAVTTCDKAKGKGIFASNPLTKNPQAPICTHAVSELLIHRTAIEKTIRGCKDMTLFLRVRSVTGGAVHKGTYLGRVVRWVYTTNGDIITYKKNGNKVPLSDGSTPVMVLDDMPNNIDCARYIEDAKSILDDLGVTNL